MNTQRVNRRQPQPNLVVVPVAQQHRTTSVAGVIGFVIVTAMVLVVLLAAVVVVTIGAAVSGRAPKLPKGVTRAAKRQVRKRARR